MTDPELLGLARQRLNMAITDKALNGWKTSIVLAGYHEGEGVHRLRKAEATLEALLGERWLENGAAKDAAFGVLRMAMDRFAKPPVVTPTDMFKPTKKLEAMSPAKQSKLMNRGHDAHRQMAAEGLLEIVDSISACAQSPGRVCMCVQAVNRGELVGKPIASCFDQEQFSGRMKMYGEDRFERERAAQA